MSSLFEKIARRANRTNMRIFGEYCRVRPKEGGSLSLRIEFGTDLVISDDGMSTEVQHTASILKDDYPHYLHQAVIERGDAHYVVEGLHERSTSGAHTTAEEWVYRVRKL